MQAIQNVWINFEVGLTIEEVDTFILNETSDENSTSDNETSSNQTSNDTEARHHPAEYTVNHSTGTVMVDYLGNQRVWWGDNDWVVDLAYADVRMLIDEARVAYTE